MRSHRVDLVVFAFGLAVFGLVALALVWSGDWAYAALANATANTGATFVVPPDRRDACGQTMVMDLKRLLEMHRAWAAYVVGASESPPGPACALFTADERSHMADVRSVFRGAEVLAILCLGVMAFRLRRAHADGRALRLARDGALLAVGLVAVVGVLAVVAFDQVFLLFHELFFPQGNFLFPSDSNLIRLYPEWYWQGITAGVGLSFIATALVAAGAAHVALHRHATTYTRAA